MMKKHFFMIIALLCMVAQGAWAQTEVSTEDALNSAITDGADIKLTADIALSEKLTIGSGQTVTIDLNGKKLSRSLSANENYGMVIYVNGGNLTIKDGSGDNSGQITGGRSYNGAGILCESGSTLTINGGTFTDNDVSRHEGDHGRGGAIFMNPNTTLTITGGVFDGNSAYNGGAIYIDDGGPDNGTAASATISDAEFQNCWVTGDGGAIYNKGSLTVSDCTISGNNASGNGGGIYIYDGSIDMKGKLVVNNNTCNSSTKNLYLRGDKIISCGTFNSGTSIGVSMENYNRTFTSGFGSNNSSAAASDFFSADVEGVALSLSDNEAYITADGLLYVECSWEGGDTDGYVVKTTKLYTGKYFTLEEGSAYLDPDTDGEEWWVLVSGSGTFDKKRLSARNDAHVVLADGCDIELKRGIHVYDGATLTIYGQPSGTGKLNCSGGNGNNAAIGGDEDQAGGNLVIHGGNITATANSNNAAGIGGGSGESSGMQSVTIYGGTVEAKGDDNGAGIGMGLNNKTWTAVTVYGGTITAQGGDYAAGIGGGRNRGNGTVKIYGGDITAKGAESGAGIGGGMAADQDYPIYIYGGTVTATSGLYAPGIGSGGPHGDEAGGDGGIVEIYGGTVTAKGIDYGAGIGGGYHSNGGTVTINGGTVNVEAVKGSGIGGGDNGKGGTLTINGGYLKINMLSYAAFVGGDKDNGTIELASNIIVKKDDGVKVEVSDSESATSGNRVTELHARARSDDNGSERITEVCDHSGATYSQKDATYHSVSCSYCLTTQEEHSFDDDGKCSMCGYEAPTVVLVDAGDNSIVLEEYDDQTVNVEYDRELTAEETSEAAARRAGAWKSVAYTVCLPYKIKVNEKADDYIAKVFKLVAVDHDSKQFVFIDADKTILPGTPVVIVVYEGRVSLNAKRVKLVATLPADGPANAVYPTYADYQAQGDNYLGYWKGSFNTFRAFFQAIETKDMANYKLMYQPQDGDMQPFPADIFADNFPDEDPATGIITMSDVRSKMSDVYYDLQGRRIANGQKPKAKGLYIVNGNKRVIK